MPDDEPRIEEREVTIKVIKVGKRSMTQSIFRQLPFGVMLNFDGPRLVGTPWGWVDYQSKEVDPWYTSFIFDKDSRLYRTAIWIRKSDVYDHHTFPLKDNHEPEWCERWDALMVELDRLDQIFLGG